MRIPFFFKFTTTKPPNQYSLIAMLIVRCLDNMISIFKIPRAELESVDEQASLSLNWLKKTGSLMMWLILNLQYYKEV